MANEVTLHTKRPDHSFADLEKMANAVAKSGLFGVKTTDQALALMLLAQAEGLHPAIAARDYHLIEGRPALKADAMLARFMAAGGRVDWHELTDAKVAATFSHPVGGSLKIEWTIEMATRAGLVNKDNWKKYPRAMLRSRVVSEGIRSVYPGVITGVYTVDELRDGVPDEIDITPRTASAEVLPQVASEQHQPSIEADTGMGADDLKAHIAAIGAAATLPELKKVHAAAYTAAYDLHDHSALEELAAAKDHAKARIQSTSGAAAA